MTPDGQKTDFGRLQRPELEAQGLKVVLGAHSGSGPRGHLRPDPRLIDFEKPRR